jgi:hypothetical protein
MVDSETMSKPVKSNLRSNDLLAALRRESSEAVAREAAPAVPVAAPVTTLVPETPARRGKAVQFWLRDEDRALIRELAAYLATQGRRATDSLVIRAALHLARADRNLLDAFHEVEARDGRYKPSH